MLRTVCIRCMEKNPKNSHFGFPISDVERKEVKATHMLKKRRERTCETENHNSEAPPLSLRVIMGSRKFACP
jgi:hypothetical protein